MSRKIFSQLAIMQAFIASEALNGDITRKIPTPFNPDNVIRKEPPRPKNHNKYIIEGVEVWALSEKRAKEKYLKQLNKLNK